MSDHPILLVEDVHKSYTRGAESVDVLRGCNLRVEAGEFIGLIGPSGSGKTTLLNIIAGLDPPTRGRVMIDGRQISDMEESTLARWRTSAIGFIFQFYHLIPVLTAYENVEMPLLLMNMPAARRRDQVLNTLDLVGLSHRLTHRPGQMSGGEQQRIGIARAIVTDPALIVADEPTGDLDGRRSEEILDMIQELQEGLKKTIMLVTHDPAAAARVQTLYRIEDGQLIKGGENALAEAFPLHNVEAYRK